MDNSFFTKFIAIIAILFAFIDGLLIGLHYEEKITQASEGMTLQEISDVFPDRLNNY